MRQASYKLPGLVRCQYEGYLTYSVETCTKLLPPSFLNLVKADVSFPGGYTTWHMVVLGSYSWCTGSFEKKRKVNNRKVSKKGKGNNIAINDFIAFHVVLLYQNTENTLLMDIMIERSMNSEHLWQTKFCSNQTDRSWRAVPHGS